MCKVSCIFDRILYFIVGFGLLLKTAFDFFRYFDIDKISFVALVGGILLLSSSFSNSIVYYDDYFVYKLSFFKRKINYKDVIGIYCYAHDSYSIVTRGSYFLFSGFGQRKNMKKFINTVLIVNKNLDLNIKWLDINQQDLI